MTEWGVVGVIIALVGLFAAVAKPMLSLNQTITTLNVTLSNVVKQLDDLDSTNTKSHERLWEHNAEQDKKLGDHESRISHLEEGEHKHEG